MTIFQTLETIGLPVAYSTFRKDGAPKAPPYLVYMGAGQDNFEADNTFYYSRNRYRLEYYFKDKDEAMETRIEGELLKNGLLYEKSDDAYIESEGVYVIYYYF